jgi:hypothetical protein
LMGYFFLFLKINMIHSKINKKKNYSFLSFSI